MNNMHKFKEAALSYAARGYYVFPVYRKGANGDQLLKSWQKECSQDPIVITSWWNRWPNANVGISCEHSNLVVLDVDPKNGGFETLAMWKEAMGNSPFETATVQTGGIIQGLHFYYTLPEGVVVNSSAGTVAPGLDFRAKSGYVIAAPSIHGDTGKAYEWQGAGLDGGLLELPKMIHDAIIIADAEHNSGEGFELPGFIPDGQRNSTLTSEAGFLRRRGYTADMLFASLSGIRDALCSPNPPMEDDELRTIADSVARYNVVKNVFAAKTDKPVLGADALYGLAGDFIRLISPHTEADPAALLFQFLLTFGCAVGPKPYFSLGISDQHRTKMNAVLVGSTSSGRKGVSGNVVDNFWKAIDPEWLVNGACSGLSSGEGLVSHFMSDPDDVKKSTDGKSVTIGADKEKRVLITESEFSKVLAVAKREGSTLTAIIRDCWDNKVLRVTTRKDPLEAKDTHVSIIGHITQEELTEKLALNDINNGFVNRFMFLYVERSKLLPFGGDADSAAKDALAAAIRDALSNGRAQGETGFSQEAGVLWTEFYTQFDEEQKYSSSKLSALKARAPSNILRLSVVYAILDNSSSIEVAHLKAAMSVVQYSNDSIDYLFSKSTNDTSTGNLLADRILAHVEKMYPASVPFGNLCKMGTAPQRKEAIELLIKLGRVTKETSETGGRPTQTLLFIPK